MFENFTSRHQDPEMVAAKDKRTRIVHICKNVSLSKAIEKCIDVVTKVATNQCKCAKTATVSLMSATVKYKPDEEHNEVFTGLIKNLTKVLSQVFFGKLF